MGAFYRIVLIVYGLFKYGLSSTLLPLCAEPVRIAEKNQNDTNFQLIFDHPLLDVSQGFIPGSSYIVRLSSVNEKVTFDGYVIQSQVNGRGFGKFTDPPPGAQLCGLSKNVGLQKIDAHSVVTATFTWLGETTIRSTCVQLTASVRSNGVWTRTRTEICKRKGCYTTISDHYGILTQDILNLTFKQHCPIVDITFQRPKHEQIFFQIRNLSMGNADSQCKNAYVAIALNLASPTQRYCGSNWSLTSFNSDQMTIQVKYLPNNSSFNLLYYTLDKRKGCNKTISSLQGQITSPNFPGPYYPNLDCYFYISIPTGQQVVLQVRTLRLQAPGKAGACIFDFLQISSQDDDRSLLKVCGHLSPLPEVTVSADVLVHFHSDNRIEDQGILISYKRLQSECDDHQILTDPRGLVFSSSNLHNCTITVYVPYGYGIQLNVKLKSGDNTSANTSEILMKMDISQSNCTSSMLEIRDKEQNTWIKCIKEATYITTKNILHLRFLGFETDVKVTYNILNINHSLIECEYGWISGDEYCYLLEREALPWEEAEEACVAYNGHLASVGNNEVQMLLEDFIKHSLLTLNDTSVWIGGNDRAYENCFEWADNRPFSFTYWFPGWVHSNFYNSQPSDDGLANQDCVEMRRDFRYATKGFGLADHFYWNDRDCRVANPYFCEKLKPGVVLDPYPPDCNRSITLSLENRREIVSSSGYPEQYPKNIECYTKIHTPLNSKILLTFISFILEDDPQCHYDYLELSEPSGFTKRYCGNWNSRLKLLRYISEGNFLQMIFKSDYSHSFAGYRAEVALYQGNDLCDDPRLFPYGNKCYLFVSYPEVTWYTARKICREMQGKLSSVESQAEQNFIIDRIQKMETYTSGTLFWLGGIRKSNHNHAWQWVDSSPFNYTDWYHQSSMKETNEPIPRLKHHNEFAQDSCLAFQWKSVKDSIGRLKNSGLYWESQACEQSGGYICKKDQIVVEVNMNNTIYGHRGNLTSPNYPATYPINLDYTIRVIGPIGTRILLQFNYLDLEWQEDCLYDYIDLRSGPEKPHVRVCGQHSTDLAKFDFVSDKNELLATVHSDYSIVGFGFEASWITVDVSSCPSRFTNIMSGKIQSVNYPSNYISNLDCVTEIFTNPGFRVWLEFLNFDVGTMNSDGTCQNDYLELSLGHNSLKKIILCGKKTDIETLKFLSFGDYIKIIFHSDSADTHLGYSAIFKTVQNLETSRIIYLQPNQSGNVPALNLILSTPSNVSLTNKLVAPLGYVIHLKISQVLFNPNDDFNTSCPGGLIQIEDAFRFLSKPTNLCAMQNDALGEQVTFISYFNSLYVRQLTLEFDMIGFDVSFSVLIDPEFLNKTLMINKVENVLGFCDPNPCLHDGICNTTNGTSRCTCKGFHTGLFCHLTKCDLNPCKYGICNLTNDDFKCICNSSYGGRLCDKYLGACASRPCGDGGKCTDVNNTAVCTCYVWWEGPKCERRVFKIPYKPLSRRMLEEPFWLGLITVSIVLLVLGCIWCIKRKFADKFERFLTEEIERSKQNQQRGRSSSINKLGKLTSSEQIATSPQTAPRSLLSRLGRSRKHSMLNLDPNSKSRRYQENRSFSFDDLLRKGSPRRRSHAILSGTGGTGPEESTKDILQSLVSPVPKLHRRMSLEEFIQMSEQKIKAGNKLTHSAQTLMTSSTEETSFSNFIVPNVNTKVLKKKVSFAKCVESAAEVLASQNSENETCGSTSSISQTIISDSDDATSGDDVPLDVSNLSSTTSSSSESPVRRIQFQDDSSSYPVVIVHQPPPDSPPKLESSSLLKTPIAEEVKVIIDSGESTEDEDESCGKNVQIQSKDDSKNSTAVFRCLQSLIPDNNPKMQLNDALLNPKITQSPAELETRILSNEKDDSDKLHAIDDLAEALEKKKIGEVCNANRQQIPIFAMQDNVRPFRKSSLDGSMLRVPEHFPRRLSVDTALLSSVPGKSPFGIPFHHHPLSKSPNHNHPRNSSQQMFVSKRLKSKPPPLQIPKLIQAEGHMTMTNRSDKPTSRDVTTPIITISNISSCESDIDSPNRINAGAQYLSPYVFMGATDDYMCTSLSNLSSSGYSSMNSPVASRCSSNNPLFPPSESEMEQPLTPRQTAGFKPYTKAGFLCPPMAAFHQPRNPNLLVDRTPSTSSREVSPPSGMSSPSRKRSSSETTDDLVDELAEDEGIGLDNKVGDISDVSDLPVKDPGLGQVNTFPPIIIVQPDQSDLYWQNLRRPSFERTLSPVSSRSESPVSERGEHFSPQFYNTDTLAPPIFTDSDCPSSEVPAPVLKPPPGKRQGRRRERPPVNRHKQTSNISSQKMETAKTRKPIKRVSPKRRNKGSIQAAEQCSSSSESSSPTAQKCLLPPKPSSPLHSAISNRGQRKKFLFDKGESSSFYSHNQHPGKKNLNQSSRILSSDENLNSDKDVSKKGDTTSEDEVTTQTNAKLRKPNFNDAKPCLEQQSRLLDDKSSSSSSSSMTTTSEED